MTETSGDRLRRAREAKYNTAREACAAHGFPYSTYVHHENGRNGYGLDEAKLYGRAFGVSAAYLLGLSSDSTSIAEVDIVGDAGVGIWREERAEGQARRGRRKKSLPVPKLKAGIGQRQAVKLIDESANRLVGMGEFAVFELVASEPAEGTNVVVDRTRNGLTERTVRTLRRRPNGTLVLETPTSIKSLFSELCYPSTNADDSLTIVGVVIGKYVDFEG